MSQALLSIRAHWLRIRVRACSSATTGLGRSRGCLLRAPRSQARLIAQRFDKRYGRAVKKHPVFRRPEALLPWLFLIEPETGLATMVELTKAAGPDNSDATVGARLVVADPTVPLDAQG